MARAYICCFLEQDYRLHTHLASFIIITGRKKILPDRRRGTLNSKCAPICVSTCCCHQVCFVQATMSFRNHWDTPTVIWASPPVNVNTMKNYKNFCLTADGRTNPLAAPTYSTNTFRQSLPKVQYTWPWDQHGQNGGGGTPRSGHHSGQKTESVSIIMKMVAGRYTLAQWIPPLRLLGVLPDLDAVFRKQQTTHLRVHAKNGSGNLL